MPSTSTWITNIIDMSDEEAISKNEANLSSVRDIIHDIKNAISSIYSVCDYEKSENLINEKLNNSLELIKSSAISCNKLIDDLFFLIKADKH